MDVKRRGPLLGAAVAVMVAGVAAMSGTAFAVPDIGAPPSVGSAEDAGLAPNTVRQIEALVRDKEARTPAQRKVDSALLAEARRRAGRPVADGVARVVPGVTVTGDRVKVLITADAGPSLTRAVASLGGTVDADSSAGREVVASVPVGAVETLAGRADVTSVEPVPAMEVMRSVASSAQRSAARGPATAAAAAGDAAATGRVVSEAVRVHGVDIARERTRSTGTGVTIGVLSDGVDYLRDSQAAGELPAVTVLPGQRGYGNEGTAMLELVHDIAPGARLVFATAFDTPGDFARNIRGLRAAGADIIVDDVIYLKEPAFYDGPIAQAVTDVSRDGALYFSAAGNWGNRHDGTSGTWEGDFVAAPAGSSSVTGTLHDFRPGPGVQTLNPLQARDSAYSAQLFWPDVPNAATTDYDLYVVDAAGDVVAFSDRVQDGTRDAFEQVTVPQGRGLSLVVRKARGQSRFLHLEAGYGRFADTATLKGYATGGTIRGHAAAAEAFAVAAAPAAAGSPKLPGAGDPPNPDGPFPGRFTSAQRSERFTSDGDRRMFLRPDGTPFTPGDFTSTGGVVRKKPDLTAADGVSTSTVNFNTFFGTSAAAPNAAAIAALALSRRPDLTGAELRAAISATAIDIEAPGRDPVTGAGIVMAAPLLERLGGTPRPLATAGRVRVATTQDGDRALEPGETAQVVVPVTADGDADVAGVVVNLEGSSGVTVLTPRRTVGAVPWRTSTEVRFDVRVGTGLPAGTALPLRATVRFSGDLSPTTTRSQLRTGELSTTPTRLVFSGPDRPVRELRPVTIDLPSDATGQVGKVTVAMGGTGCKGDPASASPGVEYAQLPELEMILTSPAGSVVQVHGFGETVVNGGAGFPGTRMCGTVFDDGATRDILDAQRVQSPFSGRWHPLERLGTLVGEPAAGTWRLTLRDMATFIDEPAPPAGVVRSVTVNLYRYVYR